MKITLFALIAGLCLVTVYAGTDAKQFVSEEFYDVELAEGIVEPETESVSIFYGIYWVLKGALKTVTGLKCTFREVNTILNASVKFESVIKTCGQESTQMQQISTAVSQIITTCQGFSSINETYCSKNSDNHSGWNCFWKMLGKSMGLTRQLSKVLGMLYKLPTGTNQSECVNQAVYELHYSYSSFPTAVKACKAYPSG